MASKSGIKYSQNITSVESTLLYSVGVKVL